MSGDLPAVEQPGSLAPTHEALERERKRVEIERRRAEVAVKANEKLQKELGTVKAGIARALRENEQYQSKARRVTLPRRCREKAQSRINRQKWQPYTFGPCMMRCHLCAF